MLLCILFLPILSLRVKIKEEPYITRELNQVSSTKYLPCMHYIDSLCSATKGTRIMMSEYMSTAYYSHSVCIIDSWMMHVE